MKIRVFGKKRQNGVKTGLFWPYLDTTTKQMYISTLIIFRSFLRIIFADLYCDSFIIIYVFIMYPLKAVSCTFSEIKFEFLCLQKLTIVSHFFLSNYRELNSLPSSYFFRHQKSSKKLDGIISN